MARRLDDELVILNLENESYFGLDPVGTRMWDLVTEASSLEQAFEQLKNEFDVEPSRLRSDLEGLLGQLVDSGVIYLAAV